MKKHLGWPLATSIALLAGCATSTGPWNAGISGQQNWTIQAASLGSVPENGKLYAIAKTNGRWAPASLDDDDAEKFVATTSREIFLYTEGESGEVFTCGFRIATFRACSSAFVGKTAPYNVIGDLIMLPISLIVAFGYTSFEAVQADDLAVAIEESGLFNTLDNQIAEHSRNLADRNQRQRALQAAQSRQRAAQEAQQKERNAQQILAQGVGLEVCQDFVNSFSKSMRRYGFVERVANGRIKIMVSGVQYIDQPWVTLSTGQELIWAEPVNWYPCRTALNQ